MYHQNKLYNDFLFIKHILLSKMQSDILNHIKKLPFDDVELLNDIYEMNISGRNSSDICSKQMIEYLSKNK